VGSQRASRVARCKAVSMRHACDGVKFLSRGSEGGGGGVGLKAEVLTDLRGLLLSFIGVAP
jgi:hypothetical protein